VISRMRRSCKRWLDEHPEVDNSRCRRRRATVSDEWLGQRIGLRRLSWHLSGDAFDNRTDAKNLMTRRLRGPIRAACRTFEKLLTKEGNDIVWAPCRSVSNRRRPKIRKVRTRQRMNLIHPSWKSINARVFWWTSLMYRNASDRVCCSHNAENEYSYAAAILLLSFANCGQVGN